MNKPIKVCNVRTAKTNAYIYVGRATGGKNSRKGHELANPFKLPKKATEQDRVDCIRLYQKWLYDHPRKNTMIWRLYFDLKLLPEPILGCWCCDWNGFSVPEPLCHAVVLAKEVTHLSRAMENADES